MSTSIFAIRCHVNEPARYAAAGMSPAAAVKRERPRKYRPFGESLIAWRGKREIAVVVRQARLLGANLSEPNLRSLEYGWTGAPDPITLTALAAIYDVSLGDVITELIAARNAAGAAIRIERTAVQGAGTWRSAGPDPRIAEAEGAIEQLRGQVAVLAGEITDAAHRLVLALEGPADALRRTPMQPALPRQSIDSLLAGSTDEQHGTVLALAQRIAQDVLRGSGSR